MPMPWELDWSGAASSNLVNSLIAQESGGNPNAISPKGAFGTMQLMPGTARDPGFGIKPLQNSSDAENQRLGKEYLGAMLKRYGGDQEAALVAYNWGPGNADKWVKGGKNPQALPAETRQYVSTILASAGGPQQTIQSEQPWEMDWGQQPSGGVTEIAKGGQPIQASAGSNPVAPGELQAGMSWSDVGKQALQNAPVDFVNTSLGLAGMAINPGGTMGQAAFQLATNPQARSEAWRNLANYASIPGIKENIATHPVGTAVDVGTLLMPIKGEGIAARAVESAAPKILSTAKLKATAGAGLDIAKQSGVYFMDKFIEPFANTIQDIARHRGFRPGRPGAAETAHILKDVEALKTRPQSFEDIHNLQMDINDAWVAEKKARGDSQLANVLSNMRSVTNKFLDNVENANGEGMVAYGDITPEQAAHIFQTSKAAYRQAKVAQKLETAGNIAAIDAKQFAQSGQANTLRREARRILRDHARGKPTGLNRNEIAVLEDFNGGTLSERLLKQARRYLSGPFGAIVGGHLGSAFGPIGTAAGTMIGAGLGEAAAKKADQIAVQNFTRFVESVREEGSQKLQGLLGQATHDHVMGTTRGRAAISNWRSKIGTNGLKAASKSLALVIGQEVRQPRLAPRIELELNQLAEQLQGTSPSEAQQNQQ